MTSGLRNPSTSLFTLTGILTDPQFRVVIHALQQRSGAELLAQPEVTTQSGRQAQMKATDVKTIITGFSFSQNTGTTGGAAVGTGTTVQARSRYVCVSCARADGVGADAGRDSVRAVGWLYHQPDFDPDAIRSSWATTTPMKWTPRGC